ncbi:alkane 1-monooxygenase [Belliella aquatica]|uniref:Alkane monooxygenase n=1 Tax=Belliella aquatica TaxID=1323734 RepID=A0ABQ1MG63_9BACT|nr:alkane 1-monooxygenase [Belliella aquatica]MCH7405056.1 alkane 1-monooxygenase [Belliella aquatica]GGC40161.1 alkane monooxygenase [Belliella aquatica]
MKDLKYLLAYSIPLSAYFALQWQGWWSWSTVILAFGIFPVLDALYPASAENYSDTEKKKRLSNRFFDLLLYICAPICFVLVFIYFQTITNTSLSINETVGLTFSIGVVLGALGINVAHELGHRSNKWEQFLAKAGLLPVFYQHFFIEHNRGHHRHVSTDHDPATARKNESIYQFYFRSVIGQYLNAWKLESERLEKKGLKNLSWNNEMIRFSVYQLTYLIGVCWYFGIGILPYALGIGVVGFLLLETINYIEHYGLRRKMLESGRYERVMPRHSWNSDHEMGRIVLFELTRHSDHHFLASRKYQILRHMDDSPQLPTGYPASMLMALVPPLWFRIMNPRLEKFAI